MRNIREETGNFTTGFLIFSGLFTVLYSLSVGDNTYLVFGILLLFTFVLAASIGGKGDTDSDLEAIGWSNKNMGVVVPLGIAGGIVALVVGSLIINLSSKGAVASTVPDFSAMVSVLPMYTASVIPPAVAVSANIIAQWLIVAPSEEAAYRILAPFAAVSMLKNVVIAYFVAAILWMATHVNAYTLQGTPNAMYLVLFVIAIITTGLLWLTGNVISGIIAHGVFNTGVILIGAGNVDTTAYLVVFIILGILMYGWLAGREQTRSSKGGVV